MANIFLPKCILYKYIAKNFLKSFFIVFICIFIIAGLLEGVEALRRASSIKDSYSHSQLVWYVVFQTIGTVSTFFAFITFIASVFFYINMNNKMELVTIRLVGISKWQIIKCLVCSTGLLGIFYITLFDTVSAFSIDKIKKLEREIFRDKETDNKIEFANAGFWFRDISNDKKFIIYAKSFDAKSNSILGARFFEFNKDSIFTKSIYAKNASILNKNWTIDGCDVIGINGDSKHGLSLAFPTKLSFGAIDKMTVNPRSISFWSILRYIDMLEKVGLSTTRYKVQWYVQLSSVAHMISLIMLSSLFCISARFRDTKVYFLKVAIVLLMAFPIHFINNILIALGVNETLPIFASTFMLPACSIAILTFITRKQ